MQLSVWDPGVGLSLRDAVNRLFEDSFVRPDRLGGLAMPLDLMETEDALVLTASLPGSSKEHWDINYEKELLTIRAEIPENGAPEGAHYLVKERAYGKVTRTLRLPYPVDAEQASADYSDGLLRLTLPKVESIKPRSIKVN